MGRYAITIPKGYTTGMDPRFCAGEMVVAAPGRAATCL